MTRVTHKTSLRGNSRREAWGAGREKLLRGRGTRTKTQMNSPRHAQQGAHVDQLNEWGMRGGTPHPCKIPHSVPLNFAEVESRGDAT